MFKELIKWKGEGPESRQALRNLLASWIVMFAAIGIPAIALPVLYAGIVSDTGWSRGEVAIGASIRFGAGADRKSDV